MDLITPQQKDQILTYLCNNSLFEANVQGSLSPLYNLGFSFIQLKAILKQFERINFISKVNLKHDFISFTLHMEANDFLLRGGFTFQELILETNLQKLDLELQNLKKQLEPEHLDSIEKISSILGTVISAITLLKPS